MAQWAKLPFFHRNEHEPEGPIGVRLANLNLHGPRHNAWAKLAGCAVNSVKNDTEECIEPVAE